MVVQNTKATQKRLPKYWLSFHRKSLLRADYALAELPRKGQTRCASGVLFGAPCKASSNQPSHAKNVMSGLRTVSRCTFAKTQIIASLLRLAQPT